MGSGIKQFCRIWFTAYGIIMAINGLWELVDTYQFGAPQPSIMDTVVAIILTFGIYWVIKED